MSAAHPLAQTPSRFVPWLTALALAVASFAALPAEARPEPPTVEVISAIAFDQSGLCRHAAEFAVSGAKGKWVRYQAERSFDGGVSWVSLSSGRADIKTNPTIAVETGFNGEAVLRLRLVKRDTGITEWALADATSCE